MYCRVVKVQHRKGKYSHDQGNRHKTQRNQMSAFTKSTDLYMERRFPDQEVRLNRPNQNWAWNTHYKIPVMFNIISKKEIVATQWKKLGSLPFTAVSKFISTLVT